MTAENESAPSRHGLPRSRAWSALLLLPVGCAVAALAFPADRPRLFGVPLFYVLHFAVCLVSTAVTALLQYLARDV
ncbi:hypothetical protein ABT127_29305 [Streptomyces sp. NPDC001904]|uniref:hypothetical protein n=1 Tax=Streptomyces sp. NPDC001904 TaxID=3154531 RepID=UPI00332584A6